MTTQNPSSSLKTINGRQHLVGLGVTVLVFIAAGIGIWQAGERGDRAIAPVAVETSDRTTAAELPRSSAVDDGRLTVYLAGPSAD
jgi:hypothetical protein